jgi:hypothetical protein
MNTDLEDAITNALHAKANTAPTPPMPRLGAAVRRHSRLIPVAAAIVTVAAVGATAIALSIPDSNPVSPPATQSSTAADPSTLAPGEVYYSLHLTAMGTGEVISETQLWQPREQAGEWRQAVEMGMTIEDGRVVPGVGEVRANPSGYCYPAHKKSDPGCTRPGDWFNPTVDFLATVSRDPATLGEQLRAEVVETLARSESNSENNIRVLELSRIGEVLTGNGVPQGLSSALREVAAAIPGVTVEEDVANLVGERGTGYSLPHPTGGKVMVIFTENDQYVGSPTRAVRHGIAPGLGQPPSRWLD